LKSRRFSDVVATNDTIDLARGGNLEAAILLTSGLDRGTILLLLLRYEYPAESKKEVWRK
jgi:hypothetical protein